MTTLGVIRWDGNNDGENGGYENENLSPEIWAHKDSWFFTRSGTTITNNANTQAIMDAEIDMASRNGIDYFVPLLDAREEDFMSPIGVVPYSGMNCFFKRYLTSSKIGQIKVAVMFQGGFAGFHHAATTDNAADWPDFIEVVIGWMTQSWYQKVLTNRPLLYWLSLPGLVTSHTNNANALTALNLLRSEAIAAGLGDPYMVALDGTAALSATLEMDARGNYAVSGPHTTEAEFPYSTLTGIAEARWASNLAADGLDLVPILTHGWDLRPRQGNQNPPSYYDYVAGDWEYYTLPTPAQHAAHVQAGFDCLVTNAARCPAETVLEYAWNENSEGGFVIPTRLAGGAILQQIGVLRGRQRESHRALRSRGIQLSSR